MYQKEKRGKKQKRKLLYVICVREKHKGQRKQRKWECD